MAAVVKPPPPAPTEDSQLATRPSLGTSGRPLDFCINYYRLKSYPTEDELYQYDVAIKPELQRGNKGLCRQIIKYLEEQNPEHLQKCKPVFDGQRNLFTVRPLEQDKMEFTVILPSKDNVPKKKPRDPFKVTLTRTAVVQLSAIKEYLKGNLEIPREAFQAFDIALRHYPSLKFTIGGRSFFDLENKSTKHAIGEGALAVFGIYQSVRPGQDGLFLNVDMSVQSFYDDLDLIDFVSQMCRLGTRDFCQKGFQGVNPRLKMNVEKELKRLRVTVVHRATNKKYAVQAFSELSAEQQTFAVGEGESVSVAQYFKKKYQALRYPNLPLVLVGEKRMFLPMEVCRLAPNQRKMRKLSDRQTSQMVQIAATHPNKRMQHIQNFMRQPVIQQDPYKDEFGIKLANDMEILRGRQLQAPVLQYGKNSQQAVLQPRDGQWNLMRKQLYAPGAALRVWGILCLDGQMMANNVHNFAQDLRRTAMTSGLDCAECTAIRRANWYRMADVNVINQGMRGLYDDIVKAIQPGTKIQLLVVILPERLTEPYGAIKRMSDTILGVPSQVVLSRHVGRQAKPQYLANVCLKINMKLGGSNHICREDLPKMDVPTIIFGADVYHPPAGNTSSPSVAALVSSNDRHAVLYSHNVVAQQHRTEVIANLSTMVREALINFYKFSKKKPLRIVFYRDGVGEGQFKRVLVEEFNAIREACHKLEPGYCPKITFVVVQKRTHTKFFPKPGGGDRSGNVPTGTVLDHTVCSPSEWDFYMVSHSGLKGTSKPTRYQILWDENEFSSDQMQDLTYRLCHIYGRCTRAVSLPAPVYYAHLLSNRGKIFAGESSESMSESTASSGGHAEAPVPIIEVHRNLKHSLYFA